MIQFECESGCDHHSPYTSAPRDGGFCFYGNLFIMIFGFIVFCLVTDRNMLFATISAARTKVTFFESHDFKSTVSRLSKIGGKNLLSLYVILGRWLHAARISHWLQLYVRLYILSCAQWNIIRGYYIFANVIMHFLTKACIHNPNNAVCSSCG